MDNQLSDAEKAEMEQHLADCPECRQQLEDNHRLWDSMGEIPVPAPSDKMQVRFDAMLETYKQEQDNRRPGIAFYLQQLFAMKPGFTWAYSLIIYLTGGLANSPQIIPGTPITLALVLLAIGYMWAPALAHLLTRLVTREGWRDTFLRPRLRQGWPYWLAAWFVPGLMTIVGAALFFAIFPRFFDPSLSALRRTLEQSVQQTGQELPFSPWVPKPTTSFSSAPSLPPRNPVSPTCRK